MSAIGVFFIEVFAAGLIAFYRKYRIAHYAMEKGIPIKPHLPNLALDSEGCSYRFSFLNTRSGIARITVMMTRQIPGT